MKFIPENETNVLNGIRIFGKFNIDNYNFYNDTTFAIEDYICPNVDHELMYKCLNSDEDNGNHQLHNSIKDNDDEANEQVVLLHKGIDIDFSHNKRLINANNHLNESIVNMTISESKELIAKSSNLTKFEEFMYDGLTPNSATEKNTLTESEDLNIANLLINNLQQDQLVDCHQPELAATNPKKSKRKIKIHNYDGTINLKNISSLTINTGCNREPSVRQSKAVNTKQPLSNTLSNTSSNKSTNTSPSSASHDEQHHQTDPDSTSYNCEFYNRLLNEIKNSFSNTVHADHNTNNNLSNYDGSNSSFTSSTASTTSSSSSAVTAADGIPGSCSKMMFRNIRNLKINIPVTAMKNEKSHETCESSNPTSITNSSTTQNEHMLAEPESEDHPVHIEQWLKQIILETETEPIQNTDILEHSILHNKQMLNANIIAAAITTGKM